MSARHFNVEHLSDAELMKKLRQYGANCGPVIDQTRRVYQRKLEMLMKGHTGLRDTTDSSQAGYDDDDEDDDDEVDDDDEEEEEDYNATRAAEQRNTFRASGDDSVRQRLQNTTQGQVQKKRCPTWMVVLFLAVVVALVIAIYSNMEPGYSPPAIDADA